VALYFADECVTVETVEELRRLGLDVVYAREVCPGALDPEILRLATESGRILVTDDQGFGELAVRRSQPAAGIVILSLYQLPKDDRARHAAAQILALGEACLGRLAIVEPGRVRLRPL
jgi:predicted nuclease of predicted toxin-antitoxin system